MEYEKFCEDCGEYFTTTQKGAKFCRSCLLEHMAQANRNAQNMKKFENITVNPRETFNDILAEIERYNKENSRHLSYGQYVALRFLERQKLKKVKKS
jgi:hypothetical protein